jgi:hypothetical protein
MTNCLMRIHYLFESSADPSYRKAQDDPNFPYVNSATARFAGTYPGELLRKDGHGIFYHYVNPDTGPRLDIDFRKGDKVLCLRNYYPQTVETVRYAIMSGCDVAMHYCDPHIENPNPKLVDVRKSHADLFAIVHGIIPTSENLRDVCERHAHEGAKIEVMLDGVDTAYQAPDFDLSNVKAGLEPLKLASALYAHNHGDVYASLDSIRDFADKFGPVEYTIVTAPARKDKSHTTNTDYERLLAYETGRNLRIKFVDYSPQTAASEIAKAHMVIIQQDQGGRDEHQKKWYHKKAHGRGAAAIWAGKPIYCPTDIESYEVFLRQNGGFNKGTVGQTLEYMLHADPAMIRGMIAQGQKIVGENNTAEVIAEKQLKFFAGLRHN